MDANASAPSRPALAGIRSPASTDFQTALCNSAARALWDPERTQPCRSLVKAKTAVIFSSASSSHNHRVAIRIRELPQIRLWFGNGGQALKTENRRSRVHLAFAGWHREIRFERVDARRAHCQRHGAGDRGAPARRYLRQARSVCEHSRLYRSKTFPSFAE